MMKYNALFTIAIDSISDDVEKFKLFEYNARKRTTTTISDALYKMRTVSVAVAVVVRVTVTVAAEKKLVRARKPQHNRKHSHLRSRGALHLFGQTLYRHKRTHNCEKWLGSLKVVLFAVVIGIVNLIAFLTPITFVIRSQFARNSFPQSGGNKRNLIAFLNPIGIVQMIATSSVI